MPITLPVPQQPSPLALKDVCRRCDHLFCTCPSKPLQPHDHDPLQHDTVTIVPHSVDHHHHHHHHPSPFDAFEPLLDALPPQHQSKLTLASPPAVSSKPIAIPATTAVAKQRTFSDVSVASSRPELSSSPTDSAWSSSPPSSPYLHYRGRSPSASRSRSPTSARSFSPPYTAPFFPPPDPYRDITHIRRTSRGNHVLYPGAAFGGTQKSGRNNYEVTVTVMDVDFDSSFLAGYLRIKGLTDDYPELTTYFEAEIIGEKYGFLTTQQEYGATEEEDMTHWGRFPAFRTLKNEARRPNLTISDRYRDKRGVVFMRWKERFLVPDWKVKDINGASFAGFYYVCVEFNPTRSSSTYGEHDSMDFPSLSPSSTRAPSSNAGPATMTGLYYHADSEPYQQLSLTHIPEKAAPPTFEFR